MTKPNLNVPQTAWRSIAAACCFITLAYSFSSAPCYAQGGGSGSRGGSGGGGAEAPGPETKPRWQDYIHSQRGMTQRRESGDAIVVGVEVVGNRSVTDHEILQQLQTRKDRVYTRETVLGDIRRLNDLGKFDRVSYDQKKTPDGQGVFVRFKVHERDLIQQVVFHGNRGLNDRELNGRAGLSVGDPLSEFTIESARRRMLDYYREEGFTQASITTADTPDTDAGNVVFRINEGPLERIWSIRFQGNTILTDSRLEKIIKSRAGVLGVVRYFGNAANLQTIREDVDLLASTYHNLGYLTATVGRQLDYYEDGKWLNVTFVINEGPRFTINEIRFVGNQFVTTESLRARLKLKPGETFDGTKMRADVGEITYGYGELGFIYAEVKPQTVMRDERPLVDLVYKVEEGDRWKIRSIRVNIEGEPHLMRETTMLNLADLRENDFIDRRKVETARRRLNSSQLLETNPQVADAPDVIIEPVEERR